jgi:hypothetical protein
MQRYCRPTRRPKEVQHIRGPGFIGLLVSGAHHQIHHLMMAKGEFAPRALRWIRSTSRLIPIAIGGHARSAD